MSRFEALQQLIADDPDDAELRYLLGLEHANRGEHEQALLCFGDCLARNRDYAYAYFHAARSLLELGRREEARDQLSEGLAAARRARDSRAAAEIEDLIDELE